MTRIETAVRRSAAIKLVFSGFERYGLRPVVSNIVSVSSCALQQAVKRLQEVMFSPAVPVNETRGGIFPAILTLERRLSALYYPMRVSHMFAGMSKGA